jgi:hypothetical protein
MIVLPHSSHHAAYAADDAGASIAANSKITTGGASTLQSGRVSSSLSLSLSLSLLPPLALPFSRHPLPHPPPRSFALSPPPPPIYSLPRRSR